MFKQHFKYTALSVLWTAVLLSNACTKKSTQPTFNNQTTEPTSNTVQTPTSVDEDNFTYPPPLNLRSMRTLTNIEALNRMSLKLVGKPAALAFKERPELLTSMSPTAVGDAFDYLTSREGENAADFADWIVTIVRDQWKIQVIRNDGQCDWCTWRMPPKPEVMAFNRKYLTRRPDRIYFDPENPGIFGGDGFELPPSNFDVPGDAGYALYEFEPLLFAAHLVLNNQPFGQVVSSNQTVRSAALQEFAANFREEAPQLAATSFSVPHWSGNWQHYERKDKAGRAWGGGVLSSIGFLRTYTRERTWAARGIYQAMLCRDIADAPVPPQSIKLEKVGDPNPLLAGNSCKGCHNMLDGLANLRMESGIQKTANYLNADWAFALYPALSSNLFNTSEAEGLGKFKEFHKSTVQQWPMTHYLLTGSGSYVAVRSISELGSALASQTEFHACQVSAFVDALIQPNSQAVRNLLQANALDAYTKGGESIKAALKAVITSEVFLERQR